MEGCWGNWEWHLGVIGWSRCWEGRVIVSKRRGRRGGFGVQDGGRGKRGAVRVKS